MNQFKKNNIVPATLYIVPTPIGNFSDITQRALSILKDVDLIAAEDTRHTGLLLQHFNIINRRFCALHDHNEQKKTGVLLSKLKKGKNIALVSNAGTPLISDPGYHLVQSCIQAGIRIVPLPGACAAITALSAAGLPSHSFCYEGFLPKKRKARLEVLRARAYEASTLIFYESTYRLLETLEDMVTIWGPYRYVVLAREITKKWESFRGLPVIELLSWVKENSIHYRGEIVLLVEGYQILKKNMPSPKVMHTLSILLAEFPLKKAVRLVSKIHGVKKSSIYHHAIRSKQSALDDKNSNVHQNLES